MRQVNADVLIPRARTVAPLFTIPKSAQMAENGASGQGRPCTRMWLRKDNDYTTFPKLVYQKNKLTASLPKEGVRSKKNR